MEHLPLLISIGLLLVWALVALFAGGRVKVGSAGIGLGLAFMQLGCAIWAAIRLFSGGDWSKWTGVWFRISPNDVFELKFAMSTATMMTWLVLSVIVVVSAYFILLRELQTDEPNSRGEKAAIPLLTIGTLLCFAAGNLTVFYFGWALLAPVAFFAVALSVAPSDLRAAASFRYIILNIIPEVVMLAGLLGVYAALGNLDFDVVNEKTVSAIVPAWAVVCLVLGPMLRNMQMPFMQAARHVASAGNIALPVFFIGHVLVSVAIFTKLYPAIMVTDGMQYYATIPALTALAAGLLALAEKDPILLVGWLSTYVSASVFLSGLVGHYQALQAMAVFGTFTAYLFSVCVNELKPSQAGANWIVGLAGLYMLGLPIAGQGWARYLEYLGLLQPDVSRVPVPGLFVGFKVLADLVMMLAVLAKTKEYWSDEKTDRSRKMGWELVLPLGVLFILGLAAMAGGRPLGGLTGPSELDLIPGVAWFERLVAVPSVSGRPVQAVPLLALMGSESDIVARVIEVGIFIVALGIAALWFLRDTQRLNEFRALWQRLIDKVQVRKGDESLLWDFVIRPVNEGIGKAAAYFDDKILDYFLSDRWLQLARAVRHVIRTIEHVVLDAKVVDGLGRAVASLGRALRLLQNGQVQFYFGLGLILMGVIVIKFIGFGG